MFKKRLIENKYPWMHHCSKIKIHTVSDMADEQR